MFRFRFKFCVFYASFQLAQVFHGARTQNGQLREVSKSDMKVTWGRT